MEQALHWAARIHSEQFSVCLVAVHRSVGGQLSPTTSTVSCPSQSGVQGSTRRGTTNPASGARGAGSGGRSPMCNARAELRGAARSDRSWRVGSGGASVGAAKTKTVRHVRV